MIDSDKFEAFKDRGALLDSQWRDYQDTIASEYLPLVRREMPPDLQKILGNTFQMPIQVPHLRKAGNEWVALLTMIQARTTLIPLESGLEAKKDIGQIETWLTAALNRLNKGRTVDHWKSEGQTYYGFAAMRLCYSLPDEPDDDDLEPYMERYRGERGNKEEDAGNAYATSLGDREKARNEYFCDCMDKSLKLRPVDSLTMTFGPDLNDPAIFREKARIPYAEFKKLRTRDGRAMGFDEASQVYILGQGENETYDKTNHYGDKSFTYTRENVRDPKTGKWHCYEYVCESEHEQEYGAYGELIQEYEIPFEYPEYLICPSGNEQKHEQDPRKRFHPILYELMVYCHELNFLLTIQNELAIMEASGQGMYLDVSKANDAALAVFQQSGYNITEGAGANQKSMWVDRSISADSTRMPSYPGQIQPLPSTLSVYLMERIRQLQERDIPDAMPSRFLVGSTQPSETAGAPASSLAMQTQAASIPRDKHLSPQDEFWEGVGWRIFGLIRSSDEGIERSMQKIYPIPATGEEGPGVQAGDQIEITAFKLRRKFDINVFTKRELLQEELQIWARADADLERGRITLEEYYEKRGYTDPLAHIEELNLERHRAATWEQFQSDEAAERALLRQLMAGIAPPIAPPGIPTPGGAAAMPEGIPSPGGGGAPPPSPPRGATPTTVPQPRPMVAPPAVGGGNVGSGGGFV